MLPFAVIVRTMDLGGDKLVPLGVGGFGNEPNPFLGLRGIRLSLRYPDLFQNATARHPARIRHMAI